MVKVAVFDSKPYDRQSLENMLRFEANQPFLPKTDLS